MHLATFVKARTNLFRSAGVKAGVFVCGNEAGGMLFMGEDNVGVDLDSLVSSLSYAYLFDTFEGRPIIPFVNVPIPRILDMRGEIQMVLKENGLDTDDLLFMDEVLPTATKLEQRLDLILVDHNELSGRWYRKFPSLSYKVHSIIDHHDDAGYFKDAVPRIVKVCGSTASLIVDMVKTADSAVLERLKELARPLLQTIIFDTVNLTWRQKDADLEAVKLLGRYKGCSIQNDTAEVGKKVMDELEDAIISVPEAGFDIFDLLYKDYKLYVHHPKTSDSPIYYGISTLHTSFSVMIGLENEKLEQFVKSVQRFMEVEDIKLLMMTNAVRERGSAAHTQQFAIFTRPETLTIQRPLYELLMAKGVDLKSIISGENFALYNQGNITISRKQFHPITKMFMETHFS